MSLREEAIKLADKYLNDTRKHAEQVAKLMEYFAKKLGEDEDIWYVLWLLHDIDRDFVGKDPNRHLKEDFDKIVDEIWLSEEMKKQIRAHASSLTGIEPFDLPSKYLASVDELSGFLNAYALMRPEGFEGMKLKSIKKKIKDKSFAAWVDREELKNCEKYLDTPFDEFVMEVAQAMSQI